MTRGLAGMDGSTGVDPVFSLTHFVLVWNQVPRVRCLRLQPETGQMGSFMVPGLVFANKVVEVEQSAGTFVGRYMRGQGGLGKVDYL